MSVSKNNHILQKYQCYIPKYICPSSNKPNSIIYSNEFNCEYKAESNGGIIYVYSKEGKAQPPNAWFNITEINHTPEILLSCNSDGWKYQITFEISNITDSNMTSADIGFNDVIFLSTITKTFSDLGNNRYRYIGIADCGIIFNIASKVNLTSATLSLKVETIPPKK